MHNSLTPADLNPPENESQTKQPTWPGPPRELVEELEKWTRYFSYICLIGSILLAFTIIFIPLALIIHWQYHVLKKAREYFKMALKTPVVHPEHMGKALERIGFQFLVQSLGLVIMAPLSLVVILIALAQVTGRLS